MSPLIKNLFFALGLAVLLYLGYTVFFAGDGGDPFTETENGGGATIATQEFLIKLRRIQDIQIDTTFFNDHRFKALEDFQITIEPEETGRPNPFEPVE